MSDTWLGIRNAMVSGEIREQGGGKKAVVSDTWLGVRNAMVSGKWLVVRVTSEKCKGMWYGVRGEKLRHCEWTPINENQ